MPELANSDIIVIVTGAKVEDRRESDLESELKTLNHSRVTKFLTRS